MEMILVLISPYVVCNMIVLKDATHFLTVARPFAKHASEAHYTRYEDDCLWFELALVEECKGELIAAKFGVRPHGIGGAGGEALQRTIVGIGGLASRKAQ